MLLVPKKFVHLRAALAEREEEGQEQRAQHQPVRERRAGREAARQHAQQEAGGDAEGVDDGDVLEALRRDDRFSVAVGDSVSEVVPADPQALYFLAGDGAVIVPLCARLQAAGVPAAQLRTEFFFNKPPKPA